MVIYIKSEGRLSAEMIERSGIDTDESKWFVFKCNVYETVIDLMRQMVKDNASDTRYMFIIDSMDALVPKGDLEKGANEAIKVAGGSLLSSDFLKRMALGLATRGHICYMFSQVRTKVQINPYEKTDPRLTNASGGNAMLHYSDWILEFQQRWNKDLITTQPSGKGDQLGHWCRIIFRKSTNEKTGVEVRYPIRYGAQPGKSIWVEYEILNTLLKWGFVKRAGAWLNVTESLIEKLESKNLSIPEKIQGEEAFTNYLDENPEVKDYLFDMLKQTLSLTV